MTLSFRNSGVLGVRREAGLKTARQAQGDETNVTGRCEKPIINTTPAQVCCCTVLIPVATTASTYLPHMRCQVCGNIYGIDGDEKFHCENPRRHCDASELVLAPEAARWAR